MVELRQLLSTSILFLCIFAILTSCNMKQLDPASIQVQQDPVPVQEVQQDPVPIQKILQTKMYPSPIGFELDDLRTIILDFPIIIRVYYGTIINEVSFIYERNEVHLGNNSGKCEEFQLEKREYIVEVSGNTFIMEDDNKTKTRSFTKICFITNFGKSFQIETRLNNDLTSDDNKFHYKVQEGNAVIGFYGTKNPSISSIGFFEYKIPDILNNNYDYDNEHGNDYNHNRNTNTIRLIVALVVLFVLIILITILILKKKRYRF